MDSASDFLRLVQHEQSLSTANRQVRLRLAESGFDDVLLPQRVAGAESICGDVEYHVACLTSTPKLRLKELIALPEEIKFVTDCGQLRSVCGLITEARAGDFDGGLAVYYLVVRDALAVMEKRTNSRIFRYQSELDIVKVLFDEWRQSSGVLAAAFEYELDPLLDARQFPPREQMIQYNETDAGFVRRLLKRCGISWYVRPGRSRHSAVDPAHDRSPAHTLVLFNDPTSLPQNAAGTVRYHCEDATDKRDVITSWSGERMLQPGSSTRHSWDYKNPLGTQFNATSARGRADQGTNGNQLAASLDDYLIEIPHVGNDVEDHWRLGQVRMARHDYETKCFRGEGNVRDFCVGSHFELAAFRGCVWPITSTRMAPARLSRVLIRRGCGWLPIGPGTALVASSSVAPSACRASARRCWWLSWAVIPTGLSTQLASDHGVSQLNLGWLTHPRANGAGEPRGEGAELRSDGAVAIRGGNGVLITVEPAPEAGGAQLDRAGLLGVVEVLRGIVDELAGVAVKHGDECTAGLA